MWCVVDIIECMMIHFQIIIIQMSGFAVVRVRWTICIKCYAWLVGWLCDWFDSVDGHTERRNQAICPLSNISNNCRRTVNHQQGRVCGWLGLCGFGVVEFRWPQEMMYTDCDRLTLIYFILKQIELFHVHIWYW